MRCHSNGAKPTFISHYSKLKDGIIIYFEGHGTSPFKVQRRNKKSSQVCVFVELLLLSSILHKTRLGNVSENPLFVS